ncbi:sulfatase [Bacteroidota bacterium]
MESGVQQAKKMLTRFAFKIGKLISLGFITGLVTNCEKAPEKPNIIVFLTDDLGYGDLGCYGNKIIQTPNIDRLSSEGIRYTDFHSGGTVSSPSRASLLTGRHPYRMGFYYILGGGAHLSASEITLPSLLREEGYSTFFSGKWHLTQFDRPKANQPDPGDHGFDYWFATVLNAFDGPESPAKFYRNNKPVGEQKGWYCDLIVKEAVDWLINRPDKNTPFFMEICTHEPHTPINPPDSLAARYDNNNVEQLENLVQYGYVPRPDDKDIKPNKKFYYATVAQLDAAFGRLMDALDKQGLRENTLVIFTSDNGPEYPVNFLESKGQWDDPIRDRCFGTPGLLRGMKRFTYEGGHRVPGIIRWPGYAPAGQVNNTLINGTDLLPTICKLIGIPQPDDRTIDGENVLPAFMGKSIKRQRPIVWSAPVHEYEFVPPMTLRDGNYLLVGFFNEKIPDQLWMDWIKTAQPEKYSLYNLISDIGQQEDLADLMPEKLAELAEKMKIMWKDLQAEAPVWPQWKAR